jgi:uncharacterized protein (TIGR02265 family)
MNPKVVIASSVDRSITAQQDWSDLQARIDATPREAQIRGLFLREVLSVAGPRIAAAERRYLPFSLYPARDYMDLLLRVARLKYPGHPASKALFELGWGVYSVFASSLAGTAIFSVVNVDYSRICQLSPRAYQVTLSPGTARCVYANEGEAMVELRSVWVFPEIFHAGIWLGAMEATRVTGTIELTSHSPCDVDFKLRWQRA